jgi:hypothetical protein
MVQSSVFASAPGLMVVMRCRCNSGMRADQRCVRLAEDLLMQPRLGTIPHGAIQCIVFGDWAWLRGLVFAAGLALRVVLRHLCNSGIRADQRCVRFVLDLLIHQRVGTIQPDLCDFHLAVE